MKDVNKEGQENKPDPTKDHTGKKYTGTGQKAVAKDKKIDTGMTGSNAKKDRNLEKSGEMEE